MSGISRSSRCIRRASFWVVTSILIAFLTVPVSKPAAQAGYALETLPSPATDVNDNGDVVGQWAGPNGSRGYVWTQAAGAQPMITDAALTGRFPCTDPKINASGVVVAQGAWGTTCGTQTRAARYSEVLGLELASLSEGDDGQHATAVNAAGVAAGVYRGNSVVPFMWPLGGSPFILPPFAPAANDGNGEARGINDENVIIGWCDGDSFSTCLPGPGGARNAYWWANDQRFLLPKVGNQLSYSHEALAINNNGQIVGRYFGAGGVTGAFRSSIAADPVTTVDLLAPQGSITSMDINDAGDIVATIGGIPFLYRNGVWTDINSLRPPGSTLQLGTATAINNLGWIVGAANNGGVGYVLRPPPPNSAPTATDSSATTPEDTAASGTLSATDPNGDTLIYTIVTNGNRGTAVVTDATTGAFTYTPNANEAGIDTFTFKASDAALDSNEATVTVTIAPVNDAPVALDSLFSIVEDAPISATFQASDVDGPALTFSIVTNGSKGSAVITNAATGAFTYTPNLNVTGVDTVTFQASDGTLTSNIGTFTVDMAAVNDAPVASDGTLAVTEDMAATGTFAANDVDGPNLTYSIVTNGARGTAVITNAATGAFTYTPNAHETDTDTFTFKANDGTLDSNVARVTVNIIATTTPLTVERGDPAWSPFTPQGTAAEISARNPRSGLGSIELVGGITTNPVFGGYWSSGLGTLGQLSALSFEWFIDPSSEAALPPGIFLRVYQFGDPRSFLLTWNGCTPTCALYPTGSWQTSDVLGHLGITPAEGNTPPASLDDVDPNAPITGVSVIGGFSANRGWSGFADNIIIGFVGQTPTRFNFEVSDPAAMRARPTITWNTPVAIPAGTALSATQLNATADVPGTFVYSPAAGTSFPADPQVLGVTFIPSDAAQYLPASRIVMQTVTGTHVITPGAARWTFFQPQSASSAITGANPRAGNGSLELTKGSASQGATPPGALHYPFFQGNPNHSVPAFGTISQLTGVSFDWFIDPASGSALPPEIAIRVYDSGDPRSFFLYWDTCSPNTPCTAHPTGSWQSTTLDITQLRIQSAGGNPAPASLDLVDPNAPIKELQVRSSFGFGQPWHGFVDNVAISLGGASPIVYNFEGNLTPQATLTVTGAPATATYGTSFTVATSGGSGGGAVTFTASGACSNTAGGASITMASGTGSCTITATKAGDSTYLQTTSSPQSVTAEKATQAALTVSGVPETAAYGTSFTVSASGGSGSGALTFAVGGACSNTSGGALITMTASSGTCSISATKDADTDYLATTSAPVSVTATPPPSPTGLSSLAAVANSSTQITLTWTDDSSNEDGFAIERSQGNPNSFVHIATTGANGSSSATYVDSSGLTGATKYYYRVRAFNAGGNSPYSNSANATTLTPPATPTGLSATAASSSRITLAWTNKANNATGFKISRSLDGVTYTVIATLGLVTTYDDTNGLAASTMYFYRVQAFNANGDSAYSNTASATTFSSGPTVPTAPSSLTAAYMPGLQIALTWMDHADNETGFMIERSVDGGATFTELARPGADVVSYTDTGLSPMTTYVYQVKAYNAVGSSSDSNRASARTRNR